MRSVFNFCFRRFMKTQRSPNFLSTPSNIAWNYSKTWFSWNISAIFFFGSFFVLVCTDWWLLLSSLGSMLIHVLLVFIFQVLKFISYYVTSSSRVVIVDAVSYNLLELRLSFFHHKLFRLVMFLEIFFSFFWQDNEITLITSSPNPFREHLQAGLNSSMIIIYESKIE